MNISAILLALLITLSGCSGNNIDDNATEQDISANVIVAESVTDVANSTNSIGMNNRNMNNPYMTNTKISEVINDPAFGDYGRIIFPANTGY